MPVSMNTRFRTRYRSSLLSLPPEVRLNIYEQLFRDTQIQIHNTAARFRTCPQRKRAESMNILATAKSIAREATPIFFREADFSVLCRHCWSDYSALDFKLPPVNNLTVEDHDFLGFYDQMDIAIVVSTVVAQRRGADPNTISLMWSLAINEGFAKERILHNLLRRAPRAIQDFRLTMSLYPECRKFVIIFVNGKSSVEVETPRHMCRTGLEKIQNLLDRQGLSLSEPVRTPNEEGRSR